MCPEAAGTDVGFPPFTDFPVILPEPENNFF